MIHVRRVRNRAARRAGWTVAQNVENVTLCGGEMTAYDVAERDVRTPKQRAELAAWALQTGRVFCSACERLIEAE